ncbi:MAG: (2Fe-2S)-binding protein, partial [Betaproteobacteria bacterium]
MKRRRFLQFCGAAAASVGSPGLAADARPQLYPRAKLLDAGGKPLRAAQVPVNRTLVFLYPFASTPCFLLNLGRPAKAAATLKTADKQTYEWKGGVGANRSVVAYSAICAHKLSYPTRDISFISFRAEKGEGNKHANVIHCCSEHSQYDPAEGARVVAGPAPQPLAAILLDWNPSTDEIHAVGTLGGEMFNEFFQKYAFRLELEHGARAKETVQGSCV